LPDDWREIEERQEAKKSGEGTVWVFNGLARRYPNFPSGAFRTRAAAEAWIRRRGLSGVLTEYPLDQGVYDWAAARGDFSPTKEEHTAPAFIETFSSAYQPHHHFKAGK
jgi:hypothetical protein